MLYTLGSLFTATPELFPSLLAQTYGGESQIGAGQIIFYIVAYVIAAFFCQKIFAKCGVENPWFAWIPILGTYAAFKAGDEPNAVLWTVLSFIPCVNIVAAVMMVIAWTRICRKVGKSPWLLLICLIPLGAFVFLGYLAFG